VNCLRSAWTSTPLPLGAYALFIFWRSGPSSRIGDGGLMTVRRVTGKCLAWSRPPGRRRHSRRKRTGRPGSVGCPSERTPLCPSGISPRRRGENVQRPTDAARLGRGLPSLQMPAPLAGRAAPQAREGSFGRPRHPTQSRRCHPRGAAACYAYSGATHRRGLKFKPMPIRGGQPCAPVSTGQQGGEGSRAFD
jgi:hypothetical protein